MSTTALLLALALGAESVGAGEHLLAGATAFRDGRFAEALVEFRVAERLGADEARPYAGAVLEKLGRHEEAVEAFGAAPASGEDALLSYYRALALRGAGLLLSADAALATIGDRLGPRISAEVARLRADVAAAIRALPPAAAVDGELARAASLRAGGRVSLAAAHCREAIALSRRSPGHHRLADAERECEALGALAVRSAP